jgi:predicted nucleotide-binding protein (sugar kinase/HSP70/actin superfamily)
MPVRVGIPRYLSFYSYYPLWKTFFEELGLDVITSSPTNQQILNAGVAEAVNDACIPIKLYRGHVMEIKDQVDMLFVPRFVKLRKLGTETFCPKFLALPDLLRASIKNLPELLDTRVDLTRGRFELFHIAREIGERFGASFATITRAYYRACQALRRYNRLMYEGMLANDALEYMENACKKSQQENQGALSIAVLGYPYLVYDRFINMDIFKKLNELGAKAFTVEMLSSRQLLREAKNMPKQMFWYYSNRAMHAAYYYLGRKRVDGIIHITAFICGPDAMLDRFMEMESKNWGRMPFMALTIDEETGTGGVETRLEAFIDMLKRRGGQ